MRTIEVITETVLQRERIALALIALVLMFGAFYAVLINQTILNAVEQRKTEGAITKLERSLAELELVYIENENEINLDYAFESGFEVLVDRHFVTRESNLSLR